jgi:hypothetical protein
MIVIIVMILTMSTALLCVITTNIILLLIMLFVGTISTVVLLLLLLATWIVLALADHPRDNGPSPRDDDHRRFKDHSEMGHDCFHCNDAVNYKKQHKEEIRHDTRRIDNRHNRCQSMLGTTTYGFWGKCSVYSILHNLRHQICSVWY